MEQAHPQASDLYASTLRRLFELGQGRSLPGRDRLRAVLQRAENPQLAVPSILVAGTNGKGRITAALSAVLSKHYRTGAFIKPHLKSVRERWRMNDVDLSKEQFCKAANDALRFIEEHLRETGEPVSFFEANVLLGALAFRSAGCEIVVWEVGLGGQHDACNLCDPLLSIITNVQYDHQAILGNTLEEIAADKAHVARPGRSLLLGPARPGWEADYSHYAPVVAQHCAATGALFEAVPPSATSGDGLPADSFALLRAARARLAVLGFPLSDDDIQAGVKAIRYRGRFERTEIEGHPVILDAAHNPDSMRWLGEELARLGGAGVKHPVVFGCQVSREPAEMLQHLAPIASSITPISVPVLRPCPTSQIAEAARNLGIPVVLPQGITATTEATDFSIGHATELDPPDDSTGWVESVRLALSLGTTAAPAVICGSIYNLGEILRAFEDGWLHVSHGSEGV